MKQIIIAVILAILGLGIYYYFYLAPKLVEPQKLLSEEKKIMSDRQIWIENQLAWNQLSTLDISSSDFVASKDNLLSKLQENIDSGKENGLSNEKFWQRQSEILTQARSRFEALNSVWEYDPEADLIGIEEDNLAKRIESAKTGLGRIDKKISYQPLSHSIGSFIDKLDQYRLQELSIQQLMESWVQVQHSGYKWVVLAIEDILKDKTSKVELESIDSQLESIHQKQADLR